MKRKRIILVALATVLVAVAGIAVWRMLSPPAGLSAPIELVEIPPGEFLMGSPEDEEGRQETWGTDETQHSVRITYAFKMGKTEVTQKQWCEVMGMTIQQQRDMVQRKVGHLSSFHDRLKGLGWAIKDDAFGTFKDVRDNGVWNTLKAVVVGEGSWPLYGEGDNYPMYYVSGDDATGFCKQLTKLEGVAGRIPAGHEYRLPTEAEWEYACRAGSPTRFANGDTEADLDKIGWYGGNSGNTIHPVGTKLPNAWGLHDMHGNVWEWCGDGFDAYPEGEVVDPFGPTTGSFRVYRGGGWAAPSRHCRTAYRGRLTPGFRNGFRIVLAPVRSSE
jgi:formylglycine-generating enzyme required for sulfatase activity